jgi:hypothetical protein
MHVSRKIQAENRSTLSTQAETAIENNLRIFRSALARKGVDYDEIDRLSAELEHRMRNRRTP